MDKLNINNPTNILKNIDEKVVVPVNKMFNQLRVYGLKVDNIKIVNWKKILSWT